MRHRRTDRLQHHHRSTVGAEKRQRRSARRTQRSTAKLKIDPAGGQGVQVDRRKGPHHRRRWHLQWARCVRKNPRGSKCGSAVHGAHLPRTSDREQGQGRAGPAAQREWVRKCAAGGWQGR
uniref:(northern house mosquito) hypothetical protein n=1 Tax=Culex pipiens TaxID=7175 RepID=A0A8D8AYG0_CULPI